MANTTITDIKDRLNIEFNDDYSKINQQKITWPKNIISLELSRGGENVLISVVGSVPYVVSFDGLNKSLKIDSINSVTPISNLNLYTLLQTAISTSNTLSSITVTSQMSNTNIATLITNVNTYLRTSTNKFVSIDYEIFGAIPTYYAFITENN